MRDEKLLDIIEKHSAEEGALLNLLLEVQERYNYLPQGALEEISETMDIPLSRLFGMASFFKGFSLTPRGRHTIHICTGTACQVWGALKLVETVGDELNIKPGETTEDLNFTLDTINCPGCCGLAPVVMVDKTIYGKVSRENLRALIKKYRT
jgi:NADH-quinone oxidoreductase subunit E